MKLFLRKTSILFALVITQSLMGVQRAYSVAEEKGVNPADGAEIKKKKSRFSTSFFSTGIDNSAKTEKDLTLVLSGLNSLLRSEKEGAKKNDLLLSRGATLLSLGKIYFLNGQTGEDKKKKEIYLKKAMASASEAGNAPDATPSVKARTYHVYGMAAIYMNEEGKAVENFKKAVELDPKSPLNSRFSLFIGEYYFEQEKYNEALPFYGMYFQKLSQEEKALAIYKSAWCFLVNKEFEKSEKAFLKIIGKKWATDFATDSLRDLAQAVTSHRDEQGIIEFGQQEFKGELEGYLPDFLTNSYYLLLRQSGNLERRALYNETQRLQKSPEKRVALAIRKLSSHQKGYASAQVYNDILEIDRLIQKGGPKPETDLFRYFSTELEFEITRAITAYIDTISKKVKTPEAVTENDLSMRLQKLLWFHIGWFPSSPNIQKSYLISLDNCQFLKDAECSMRTARLILKEEKLKKVWSRARSEILLAQEQLAKSNAEVSRDYQQDLRDYVDNEKPSKEWSFFAKKYSALLLTENKGTEAEIYLKKIYDYEPTPENLYRKMNYQYKAGKYGDIVSQAKSIPNEGPYNVELKSIVREASLASAQNESAKGNFEAYEKSLFQFLSLNPPEDKADLVRSDYLEKVLQQKNYDKVLQFFQTQPPEKKYQGVFAKPMEQLLLTLFSLNRFNEALALLKKDSKLGDHRKFDIYWFRIGVALNGGLSAAELKWLSSSDVATRISFFSIVSVSSPEIVQAYYSQYPPVDLKEKRLWILSRQISEGSKVVNFSKNELSALSGALGADILPVPVSTSERLAKMIDYPQPLWSQVRLAKVTPDAMERVRTIRRQLMRDLAKIRPEGQKRLILNAMYVEKRMAWFFENTPVPKELSPDEKKQYRAELDNFAIEYRQQIAEYLSLLSAVISIENEQVASNIPLPDNFKNWKRNRAEPLLVVEQEAQGGHHSRAMIILESKKLIGQIEDADYYRTRSYLVLSQFPSDFSAQYIQSELVTVKQESVLREWKNLVGMAPERGVASGN